jgi:replicative DNA helicase
MSIESVLDYLTVSDLEIPLSYLFPHNEDGDSEIPDFVFTYLKTKKELLSKIHGNVFEIIDAPLLNMVDLEGYIRQFLNKIKKDSSFVIVDLLTLMQEFSSSESAYSYESAINELHYIAKRNNVSILGVVQSRRPRVDINVFDIEDLEKFRPKIEQIKNSGAFEERARTVLSLFRPKHFADRYLRETPNVDPETVNLVNRMVDVAEVQVLKQSFGSIGTIATYLFEAQWASFYPYREEL